ncbi:MAG TPA: ABC transporter ATP-binding protein [Steroidobacteraceae bacterium]|nr:ABC transporter ATP-binding protein [Steroidobacteraceae bacterium]
MLSIQDLSVSYGAIRALHGVNLRVPEGGIVTLIGSNGAGKSTTLRTVSGLIRPQAGSITYCGERIEGMPPHRIVERGLCHVPEGRMVFGNLTVRENLAMGAYLQHDQALVRRERDYVFSVFPRLAEREKQLAGTLSGGEQQMLAIGRALMSQPRFLMLDEPSLGIAPLLVKAIFGQIAAINRERGITILLVEQNANLALEVASHGFVLETGQVILDNDSAALRADPRVRSAYLGG